MFPAPTLVDVLSHRQRYQNALCCILFAPPFTSVGKEGVIPRIAYLSDRSAEYVHFYCAGYGGYWHRDEFPDMQEIGDVHYPGGTVIPWAFSQRIYAKFVSEFESATNWKYSGEADMVVFDSAVSYDDCLVFNLGKMIKDEVIEHSSELFESLIRYATDRTASRNPSEFSDRKIPGLFGNAVLAALSEGPKSLGKAWKKGVHYATRDIRKK